MTKDEALQTALEQPGQDDYKTAYIKAMVASNEAGFSGMSAAETIRELDRMVSAPVQEPVGEIGWGGSVNWHKSIPEFGTNLYTTPHAAQRQWVGLADDDVYLLAHPRLARAIEAKLREKNNGGSKPRESP
jgi:hypothetical protein